MVLIGSVSFSRKEPQMLRYSMLRITASLLHDTKPIIVVTIPARRLDCRFAPVYVCSSP